MDVQNIVNDILKGKKTKNEYMELYPDFFEKMPTLSKKLFEKDLDENILKYLMNQKTKIDTNKISEYDASVKVGTILVDKYVKDKLPS
jgi:hypothetical protein